MIHHAMQTLPLLVAGLLTSALTVSAQLVVTFDDLAFPPDLDAAKALQEASATGPLYSGVVWDSRVEVVGRNYRVDTVTPGPFFGIPHSGDFFINNQASDPLAGQAISLTTTMVLLGAWFGQNEYYGFGGGADQITIKAMNGAVVLGSVVFDLLDNNPGEPEPLSFVDTSAFSALSGITGYEIDHRAPEEFADNWIADDFTFAAIPESSELAFAVALGLAVFSVARKRRQPSARVPEPDVA
jgi:hypothetical protein